MNEQLITADATSNGWQIADLSQLDWVLARIAGLDRRLDENERMAQKIAARLVEINGPVVNAKERLQEAVMTYMQTHRDEILSGGNAKSRDLLFGRIGWRKKGGRLVVNEKKLLEDWLSLHHKELARLKVEPNMKELQAWFDRTGELPPGCEYEPERDEPFAAPVALEIGATAVTPVLMPGMAVALESEIPF